MRHRLAAVAIGVSLGCASGSIDRQETEALTQPVLLALSTQELAVGSPLDFFGAHFLHGPEGRAELHFVGDFVDTEGTVFPVDLRIRPHFADGNRLVWAQFGPFANPFVPGGNNLGEFVGTVTAVNIDPAGREAASEALPTRLELLPSIVIRALEPIGAQCNEPVRRLLAGFPYRVVAEAIGFTPVSFTYVISGEAFPERPRLYRRAANGTTDVFGFTFDPVPNEELFYLMNFTIEAPGTDGQVRSISLVFGVHRPVEYVNSGAGEIAEFEPARPMSGCLSGGAVGREVTYTDTQTDTRTRTVGLTWDEAWLEAHTGTVGASRTEQNGVHIAANEATTEGWMFGWNTETGVEGGGQVGWNIGLDLLVRGSMTQKVGFRGEQSGSYTRGWTVGRDYSVADTESWALSATQSYQVAQGSSDFWAVSSSESESLAFTGRILPSEYAVFYRQTVRMAVPGALVAYNLCGVPNVVAQADFFDYTWAIDLAQGLSCPPFPVSSLPQAECFKSPCRGEQ